MPNLSPTATDRRSDLYYHADIGICNGFPYRMDVVLDRDRAGRTDGTALPAAHAVCLRQILIECRHDLHSGTSEGKVQDAKSLDLVAGTHAVSTRLHLFGSRTTQSELSSNGILGLLFSNLT